jgi:hypothetical protein
MPLWDLWELPVLRFSGKFRRADQCQPPLSSNSWKNRLTRSSREMTLRQKLLRELKCQKQAFYGHFCYCVILQYIAIRLLRVIWCPLHSDMAAGVVIAWPWSISIPERRSPVFAADPLGAL